MISRANSALNLAIPSIDRLEHRFIAPAKNDFRLSSTSPAFKLGFQPIDLRIVGAHD
jgi:hypothetical protein